VLGVLQPVGGGVQDPAFPELRRRQGGKRRLHHAALVMALLRPRVGEEKMDRGERPVGDHVLEDVHRVVADDTQIFQLLGMNSVQETSDPWAVDLDRDEIHVGMRLGDLDRGFAHARADLEHKLPRRNDLLLGKWNAVLRKQLFERPLLRGRRPALAQDITTNWPVQAAFGAIFPSVGELGVAE